MKKGKLITLSVQRENGGRVPVLTRMSITRWLDNIIRRKRQGVFSLGEGRGGGRHCMLGQVKLKSLE